MKKRDKHEEAAAKNRSSRFHQHGFGFVVRAVT
jgi:hypothetical protein